MKIGDGGLPEGRIVVDRREALLPPASRHTREAKGATPDEGPSPFARILAGLGREVDRGEAIVRRAVDGARGGAGKEMGNGEFLALQAGVYRYSEAVDLSAKLIDRAASGVKTVLQGQ